MIAGIPYPIRAYRVPHLRSFAMAVAVLAAVLLLLSVPGAEAKPKKPVSNGCTAEQIQAPSAGPCIDQLEKDIIAGVAYPHALYCDETGVYCCQGDNTRTFNCKKVAAKIVKPPTGAVITMPPAKLKANP